MATPGSLRHHCTIGNDLHRRANGTSRGSHHQLVLHVDLVTSLAGLEKSTHFFGKLSTKWDPKPTTSTPPKTNIAGWNIPMFNRKYIFIHGPFSMAMLVYQRVGQNNSTYRGREKKNSYPGCPIHLGEKGGLDGLEQT